MRRWSREEAYMDPDLRGLPRSERQWHSAFLPAAQCHFPCFLLSSKSNAWLRNTDLYVDRWDGGSPRVPLLLHGILGALGFAFHDVQARRTEIGAARPHPSMGGGGGGSNYGCGSWGARGEQVGGIGTGTNRWEQPCGGSGGQGT